MKLARGGRPGQPVTVERRAVPGRRERTLVSGFRVRLTEIEARLAAVEQRVGFGPDVSEIDKEIVRVLGEKHAAADVQDYERAAELRDTERRLTAEKAGKQREWSAAHPDLVSLGETVERLEAEVCGCGSCSASTASTMSPRICPRLARSQRLARRPRRRSAPGSA